MLPIPKVVTVCFTLANSPGRPRDYRELNVDIVRFLCPVPNNDNSRQPGPCVIKCANQVESTENTVAMAL